MNHLIDHDMNIPVIDGKMDLLAVENELKKRLGNELDVVHFYELWPENRLKDQHCKPWLLEVNHNQYLNSCNLTTPSKIEAEIYPKAMRLSNFSSDLEIVPHKWFNFVSNYFEKRDFGTRKKTHNVLLKIKELFKIFNPSVYVIEGVDQSFGCFEDNLEVGTSIEETFRHGGKYEKRLVSEFERWPNGFHLMGEKDKEKIEPDHESIIVFYQNLNDIFGEYVHDEVLKNYVWTPPNIQDIERALQKDHNFDYSTFVDERDGEMYKAIKIGNQVWMAENLRYKISSDGEGLPPSISVENDVLSRKLAVERLRKELENLNDEDKLSQTIVLYPKAVPIEIERIKKDIKRMEKVINAVGDGKKLGCLYTWYSANNIDKSSCLDEDGKILKDFYWQMKKSHWQGIAPKGWRIPSVEDFQELVRYCDEHAIMKTGLSLKGVSGWCYNKNFGSGGTDEFGFNAQPSGFSNILQRNIPPFKRYIEPNTGIGIDVHYWTSTPEPAPFEEDYAPGAYYYEIDHTPPNLYPMRNYYREDHLHKGACNQETYMAVRCIKNE